MRRIKIEHDKFNAIIFLLLIIAGIFAVTEIQTTDYSNYPASGSWFIAIPLFLLAVFSVVFEGH